MAQITLCEITKETLSTILKLEVNEYQKCFVATNAKSIAQAHFEEKAWFRAICADDTPVGFVMLYLDQEKAEYFLWRFMIDRKFQSKGFGYMAMEIVIDMVRKFPNAEKFVLSFQSGEGNPSGFYSKLGFKETGEVSEGERVMEKDL
ncbi:MAG: GNAT family N-acetyltransferase [candidate division Zixibacteria bacterium]|nr:GNAT family N-acetyltransferase [candidate division Zixibacteria bacterium]